jgi:hypothetical protein
MVLADVLETGWLQRVVEARGNGLAGDSATYEERPSGIGGDMSSADARDDMFAKALVSVFVQRPQLTHEYRCVGSAVLCASLSARRKL